MSNVSERVKKWRHETKARMVKAMGEKCQGCGYRGCPAAFDFHHFDPKEKDFGFGAIRASCKSWDRIVEELRKCVLLCANCHREVHSGYRQLGIGLATFDEAFADYKEVIRQSKQDCCPICKQLKPISQKACSLTCAGKARYGDRWFNIDVIGLVKTGSTFTSIADQLGCSEAAVRKRYKKLTIGDTDE